MSDKPAEKTEPKPPKPTIEQRLLDLERQMAEVQAAMAKGRR